MKFETVVLYIKMGCVFGGTALLALQSGLGQWVNTGDNPPLIAWTMIIGGSLGAGLVSLGGFLSSAFGDYMKQRNGIDLSAKPPETKP